MVLGGLIDKSYDDKGKSEMLAPRSEISVSVDGYLFCLVEILRLVDRLDANRIALVVLPGGSCSFLITAWTSDRSQAASLFDKACGRS
jgi:hypothetical protein